MSDSKEHNDLANSIYAMAAERRRRAVDERIREIAPHLLEADDYAQRWLADVQRMFSETNQHQLVEHIARVRNANLFGMMSSRLELLKLRAKLSEMMP